MINQSSRFLKIAAISMVGLAAVAAGVVFIPRFLSSGGGEDLYQPEVLDMAAVNALPGFEDLDAAFAQALGEYSRLYAPERGLTIIVQRVEGDHAFAIVQELEPPEVDGQGYFVALLAMRGGDGNWRASAPGLVSAGQYNAWLAAFPEALMDIHTQAYLSQAVPEIAAANFSGHMLPWLFAMQGFVAQKDSPAGQTYHDAQVDFNIQEFGVNHDIYASKPGTVVFVKESSPHVGPDCNLAAWPKANVVVVQHGPSEYSWYYHLVYDSVPVSVGMEIPAGTMIGKQGNSGFTCGSTGIHLHYMASTSVPAWTDPENPDSAPWPPVGSLTRVDFVEVTWSAMAEDTWYVSQNKDPDLIYKDDFESGDLTAWDSEAAGGGDLSATAEAKLVGGFGMQALVNDSAPLYVQDDTPAAESRYRVRFYFDPNGIALGDGDTLEMFTAYSDTSDEVLVVQLGGASPDYTLRARLKDDGAAWSETAEFGVGDDWNYVELDWQAASAAGADDGSLTLWVNGTQEAELTGIDNDTHGVDFVRLGAGFLQTLPATIQGTLYFEAFESHYQNYIGPHTDVSTPPESGIGTIGVYDPIEGRFKLRNSNDDGLPDFDFTFAADISGGIPIIGDWDGNGVDTIGVFDPVKGEFRLRNSNSGGPADIIISHKRLINATPLAGDWDGDGVDTLGIYVSGTFFMRNAASIGPADLKFSYGDGEGFPITGDWDGDGVDTIGIYTPVDSFFSLRNSNTSGEADLYYRFGPPGYGLTPVVGDWDGDGDDNVGLFLNQEGVNRFGIRFTHTKGSFDLLFQFGTGDSGYIPLAGDWDGE